MENSIFRTSYQAKTKILITIEISYNSTPYHASLSPLFIVLASIAITSLYADQQVFGILKACNGQYYFLFEVSNL